MMPDTAALFPDRVRAVIFDVDGTLYNQRSLRWLMLRSLLWAGCAQPAKQLRTIRFLKAYREAQEAMRKELLDANISERQLNLACERARVSKAEAAAYVSRWFNSEPLKHLAGLRDAAMHDCVRQMKARGLALGVFSDYPPQDKLKALGLDGMFDVVVCSSDADVGRLKPHPRGLEVCLEHLRAGVETAVYVGDRMDVDAACARAAGVHGVIIGKRVGTGMGVTSVRGYRELFEVFERSGSLTEENTCRNLDH